MADFWERKREELVAKGELPGYRPKPTVVQQNGVWWMVDTGLRGNLSEPQERSDSGTEHDFSKAAHLKASGHCPNCGSGNFMEVSKTVAPRCFDCGFVQGRQVNDVTDYSAISARNVPVLKVKQTEDGGARRNSTHYGSNSQEINYNNALLEQSEQGR